MTKQKTLGTPGQSLNTWWTFEPFDHKQEDTESIAGANIFPSNTTIEDRKTITILNKDTASLFFQCTREDVKRYPAYQITTPRSPLSSVSAQ